jgi:flagellar biosynthesis activator protein FlaF
MNVATHAHSLYGQARSLKTPRDLEYEVFARITGRLKVALAEAGHRTTPALAAALHENRQLWSVLAVDLAQPENGLAPDLRARLFYLAEVVLAVTDRVLSGSDETGLLVELNTTIMRGLRGEGPR